MSKDARRDAWVEDNCPNEKEFSRGFVKHLMKQAYDEGRRIATESKPKQPEIIGPYDIPD